MSGYRRPRNGRAGAGAAPSPGPGAAGTRGGGPSRPRPGGTLSARRHPQCGAARTARRPSPQPPSLPSSLPSAPPSPVPPPRRPPWRRPHGDSPPNPPPSSLLRREKGGRAEKWPRLETPPRGALVPPGGEAALRAPRGLRPRLGGAGKRGKTERERPERRFLPPGSVRSERNGGRAARWRGRGRRSAPSGGMAAVPAAARPAAQAQPWAR